jgi:ATP-dependent protease ClpP protease subunit
MTAKIVSSVLNKNRGQEITVNINSPGGDFFEGLAIYNLLKEHDAPVVVKIVGLAASAASVVAMGGTTIKIADAGYLMFHRAWTCVCGNSNDMRKVVDRLQKFDETMCEIYSKRSGTDKEEIKQQINESDDWWISGKEAIELGYADKLLDSDDLGVDEDDQAKYNSSLKQVDIALAKQGHTRSQRRGIIKDLTSTPCATVKKSDNTPCADIQKPAWEALAAACKL